MNRAEWSHDKRLEVVTFRRSGMSFSKVSTVTGVPRTSVRRICSDANRTGKVDSPKRGGRPRIMDSRAWRQLRRVVKKNRKESLRKIAGEFNLGRDRKVSMWTLRREMSRKGLNSRIARRKPMLMKKHKRKRLLWGKEHLDTDWESVVFTDESKFLVNPKKRKRVWRFMGEELADDCVVETKQAGGGGVMVWGSISSEGPGQLKIIEGKMNHRDYINVLEECFVPSYGGTDEQWTLQDDNSSVHRARAVVKWKHDNDIPYIDWPAMSPDLNPIENLWDELDDKIRKRQTPVRSVSELKEALFVGWSQIDPLTCKNLVASMSRRINAVIDAKGGHTKY